MLSDMSGERARQKRLERKRRKREERRRLARRGGHAPAFPVPPMSDVLTRFADPWLERLLSRAGGDRAKYVLQLAALIWNAAVAGERLWPSDLDAGRLLFALLDWPEDFEDEAGKLFLRKAFLFPGDRRFVLDVEVAREGGALRVYAQSAAA